MNELRDIFTKYKAVVFFDTETTGLEAESCQIIELAAIRVEKTERGTLRMADSADVFVKLPEGERIPQKIVELTGITDEQLENEGITEAEAAARFTELISGGRVLLVAHNAQFDLLFTAEMLRRHGNGGPEALKAADYLDSLTVYKDRRAYPHKLANAILTYKLEGKVQNSHRAIDDVAALFEVCKAMDAERSDLLNYNIGGVDPETLPAGASKIARLNIKGRMIDFLTYEDTYTELDGTVKQYIPQGMIAVGAPAAGRTVYGAITQVEQTDGEFHTYTGVNVPKYISDAAHNTRELTLSSAPLPMPNNECPFSVAKVIN